MRYKSFFCKVILLASIIIIFLIPLRKDGLLVGGDWTFPYSKDQMGSFFEDGFVIWNRIGSPLGAQIPHKNLFILQILSYPFIALGVTGVFFQKLIISIVFLSIGYSSFFLLEKMFKGPLASFVGSITYIFSPIVFNYFNMGWIFVLLFLAIQPLIVYHAYMFLNKGGLFRVLLIGVLSSVALFQAQALFWGPLIIFSVGLGSLRNSRAKETLLKTIFLVVSSVSITALVHSAWIIPSFINRDSYVTASTSTYDAARFSGLVNLRNQMRGWGSLFNEQFEISFGVSRFLLPFSFVGIIMAIIGLVLSKGKNDHWVAIGLILFLTAPILYLSRDFIGSLPFSNIIRDVSRFIVIGNLGMTILVAHFVTTLKKNYLKLLALMIILISSYPFFIGELYIPKINKNGVRTTIKDQRGRLLSIPMKENEAAISNYRDQLNLFYPTGGFVHSESDNRFQGPFAEIGDIEGQFSPYGVGIYMSDKSGASYQKFAKKFLESSVTSQEMFMKLSRIFGINNIFIRKGLTSNINPKVNSNVRFDSCVDTGLNKSDWNIKYICHVEASYPLIYIDKNPVNIDGESFEKYLMTDYFDLAPKAVYNCPTNTNCSFVFSKSKETPDVNFMQKGKLKFLVSTPFSDTNQLLVLNQSYHPGWILVDANSDKPINSTHVVVNDLVNGWVLPPSTNDSSYIIKFSPQSVYERLYPISVLFFVLTIFSTLFLYIRYPKK